MIKFDTFVKAPDLSSVVMVGTLPDLGSLKIAPFVEGYSEDSIGGRGGSVMVVTNSDDSGSGSWREAWDSTSPRVILFDTPDPLIDLTTRTQSGSGNVSVFAQSARGEGIEFRRPTSEDRAPVWIEHENVLLQHMKFRPGGYANGQPQFVRALNLETGAENVVVDRCSFQWSTDQLISHWDSPDVTWSHCLFSEPVPGETGSHQFAFLAGSGGTRRVSMNKCVMALADQRVPQWQLTSEGDIDQVNCLVYGSREGSVFRAKSSGVESRANMEDCLFIDSDDITWSNSNNQYEVVIEEDGGTMRVYANGNKRILKGSSAMQDITYGVWQGNPSNGGEIILPDARFPTTRQVSAPSVTRVPVVDLEAYLDANAGALAARRDAVDQSTFTNIANRTGVLANGPSYQALSSGPSRLDLTRDDKIHADFRSLYGMSESVNGITESPTGSNFTWFEHFMFYLQEQTT